MSERLLELLRGRPRLASGPAAGEWQANGLVFPSAVSVKALGLVVLVTAILARIYVYWRAPSLSSDEASLALNVITHPALALVHKLDFQQLAPLGFMWVQRLIVDLAGVSERTLRLFPLIAGCVSVVAVWDLSKRYLDRYAPLVAAALIGFSPFALFYSNTAKQYGIELFVTATLLWLRSRSGDQPRPAVQIAVISAGAVACLLSLPAIFVLGGLWASYAAVALQAENRRQALIFPALAGLIWVATFGVMYMTLLAPNTDPYLFEWWRPLDLSLQRGDVHMGSLIAHGFLDPLLSILSRVPLPLFAAGCILLPLGGYALVRLRGPQTALLFLTPLLLCLAAAMVGKWYLAPRLMLWSAPLCAVLIAAAICWMGGLAPRFSTQVQLLAAAALILFPLKASFYWLRHPAVQDLRGAVEFTERAMQPGDVVYVFAHAMPGWLFYSMDWARPDHARYDWLKHATEQLGPQFGDIAHRDHPVVAEGLDLWRPYRLGVELVGISEGFASRGGALGVGSSNPADPGWSDNEVRRILAAHPRHIILLASGVRERTTSVLLDCLGRNGGVLSDEFRSDSRASRAELVVMSGSGPAVPCSY